MTIWCKQQTEDTIKQTADLNEALNTNVDVDAGIIAYRAQKLTQRKHHDAHVLDYDKDRDAKGYLSCHVY